MPKSKKPRKKFVRSNQVCGWKCYRQSTVDYVLEKIETAETSALMKMPTASATLLDLEKYCKILRGCQFAYFHRRELMDEGSDDAIRFVQDAVLDFNKIFARAKETGSSSLTGDQLNRVREAIQICADFAKDQLSDRQTATLFIDEINASILARDAVDNMDKVVVSRRVVLSAIKEVRHLSYRTHIDPIYEKKRRESLNRLRMLIESENKRNEAE